MQFARPTASSSRRSFQRYDVSTCRPPSGIRSRIFRYTLSHTGSEPLWREKQLQKLARVLLTCKWIRSEASHLLFENEAKVQFSLHSTKLVSSILQSWTSDLPNVECQMFFGNSTIRRFRRIHMDIQFDEAEDWRSVRDSLRTFCHQIWGGKLAHLYVTIDSLQFTPWRSSLEINGLELYQSRGCEQYGSWSPHQLSGFDILRGLCSLSRLHKLDSVDFSNVPQEVVDALRPRLLCGVPRHLREMENALTHRHLRGPGIALKCAVDEHDEPAFRAIRERYIDSTTRHLRRAFERDPESNRPNTDVVEDTDDASMGSESIT